MNNENKLNLTEAMPSGINIDIIAQTLANGKYYDETNKKCALGPNDPRWNELFKAASTFDRNTVRAMTGVRFMGYVDSEPGSRFTSPTDNVYIAAFTEKSKNIVYDKNSVNTISLGDIKATTDEAQAQPFTREGAEAVLNIARNGKVGFMRNNSSRTKNWKKAELVELPGKGDAKMGSVSTPELQEGIVTAYLEANGLGGAANNETIRYLGRTMCPNFKAPLIGNAFIDFIKKYYNETGQAVTFTPFRAALTLAQERIVKQSELTTDTPKTALLYNLNAVREYGDNLASVIKTYSSLLANFKGKPEMANSIIFDVSDDDVSADSNMLPEMCQKILYGDASKLTEEDLKDFEPYKNLDLKTASVRPYNVIASALGNAKLANDNTYVCWVIDNVVDKETKNRVLFNPENGFFNLARNLTQAAVSKVFGYAFKESSMDEPKVDIATTSSDVITELVEKYFTYTEGSGFTLKDQGGNFNIDVCFRINSDYEIAQIDIKENTRVEKPEAESDTEESEKESDTEATSETSDKEETKETEVTSNPADDIAYKKEDVLQKLQAMLPDDKTDPTYEGKLRNIKAVMTQLEKAGLLK